MSVYSSSLVSAPTTAPGEWLTLSEASREYRLGKSTLRKWDRLGKLKAYRVACGELSHRRFRRVDLDAFLGRSAELSKGDVCDSEQPATGPTKLILCARVSTPAQREDLKRQVARLEAWAAENHPAATIHRYVRTASGLNASNAVFVRMVNDIVSNRLNGATLICTFKDRVLRFGYDLLKTVCDAHGITIIQIEAEEDKSYIQELTEDILAITHIASCKLYGKRGTKRSSASNAKALPQSVVDEVNGLLSKGYSIRTVFARLKQAGTNVYEDGKAFSIQIIRRLARAFKANAASSLALSTKPGKASFAEWLKARLRVGGPGSRVKRSRILKAYADYCEANGLKKVQRKLALEQLAKFTKNLNVESTPCGESGNDRLFTGLNLFDKHTGAVSTAKPAC
jgi:putative resolvase